MRLPRGFTLVEVLLIVLLLGILVAIAMPLLSQHLSNAQIRAAQNTATTIANAIDHYKLAHDGSLPGEQGTGEDLIADLNPYLRRFPANPIQNSVEVRVFTTGQPLREQALGRFGWLYDNRSGEFLANRSTFTRETLVSEVQPRTGQQ